MTFVLTVDPDRWHANVDAALAARDDPATGGTVVPVAKSNGYGLGQALVAHQMRARRRRSSDLGSGFSEVSRYLLRRS